MTVLYCVIESGEAPGVPAAAAAAAAAGLPGAGPVRVLPISGALGAVVATVPDDEYEPDNVSARLRDMDWVSRAAVAHEQVIERAMASATSVLPMKLLTLFSSDAKLVADLKKRRAQLSKAAARVARCQEFGLRVNAVEAAEADAPAERPASGLAFLERKKEARDVSRERTARRAAFARDAWDALAATSRDAVQRPLAGEALERPLLDAAFLVAPEDRAGFAREVERLRADADAAGCALILTGPWPPYHFVQV